MNFSKTFLHYFVTVTTAVVFISGLDAATSDYASISKYTLLEILLSSAVTAFLTAVVFSYSAKTRKQYLLQMVIHFVLLCIVMIVIGTRAGWVEKTPSDMLLMCLYVAVVYAIVTFFSWLLLKREADEFNRALDERRKRRS